MKGSLTKSCPSGNRLARMTYADLLHSGDSRVRMNPVGDAGRTAGRQRGLVSAEAPEGSNWAGVVTARLRDAASIRSLDTGPTPATAHNGSAASVAADQESFSPFRLLFPRVEPASATRSFHALQEWEGHVTAIRKREFCALLVDVTAGASSEEEEAWIPLAEISEDDARNLRVGGIFRWVIGYEREYGTKRRVSQIVFRDLPALTPSDIKAGRAWAQGVCESLTE